MSNFAVVGLGPTEIIIILVIVLLLFGAKRLPEVGRSLGHGMRGFKDAVTGKDAEGDEREQLAPPAEPGAHHDADGRAGEPGGTERAPADGERAGAPDART